MPWDTLGTRCEANQIPTRHNRPLSSSSSVQRVSALPSPTAAAVAGGLCFWDFFWGGDGARRLGHKAIGRLCHVAGKAAVLPCRSFAAPSARPSAAVALAAQFAAATAATGCCSASFGPPHHPTRYSLSRSVANWWATRAPATAANAAPTVPFTHCAVCCCHHRCSSCSSKSLHNRAQQSPL
jgi:hypothetical protein